MLESKSIEVDNLINLFDELKNVEKFELSAILLEHWQNELLNEGNFLTGDEAIEKGKILFLPSDIDFENCHFVARLMFIISKELKDEEITDELLNIVDIEPKIKISDNSNEILKRFYSLLLKDKMDFLLEILYILNQNEKFNREAKKLVDINDLLNNILNYRNKVFKTNYDDTIFE